MRCPTCKKEFHAQPESIRCFWADQDEHSRAAIGFAVQRCPACLEFILLKIFGTGNFSNDVLEMAFYEKEEIIYPVAKDFKIPSDVPAEYALDLTEAQTALAYSAKASAALSRRLLQKTLQEKLGIKKRDLSSEIEAFTSSAGVPSYLAGALDAVRNIGNFAAHPMKSTNTGAIVEVEDGEAEWLIEVLESLLDFVFVQPAKLQARRDALNQKLKDLGKPLLKAP